MSPYLLRYAAMPISFALIQCISPTLCCSAYLLREAATISGTAIRRTPVLTHGVSRCIPVLTHGVSACAGAFAGRIFPPR
eukprot:1294520-Rhodomonas_salina.1